MSNIKIALHQFNPVIGNLDANAYAIRDAIELAKDQACDLFITSELAISGYPPEDLLLRESFYASSLNAMQKLLQIDGITIVCGCPYQSNKNYYNSAFVIRDGQILGRYDKWVLPNYGVFDELRYFSSGSKPLVFKCNDVQIGILICEDMWETAPATAAKNSGAEILCCLNASPYEMGKYTERLNIAKARVKETKIPLIYVNQVGGQDELVFDGASFVLDKNTELCLQLKTFTSEIGYIDYSKAKYNITKNVGNITPYPNKLESVYNALVLAVKDYINKNDFKGIVLGLSGGIDSALTLAISFDALGRDMVMAVMLPSQYTAEISNIDAKNMIDFLGIKSTTISIETIFNQLKQSIAPTFAANNIGSNDDSLSSNSDTTYENLQARIRGVLLMAISNKLGYLVLTTSNKSEIATGYATIYGDMVGGFAPLKDISKTLVYELSNFRNSISAIIPPRVITRPPSAELRENQTDQDSLPDYVVLDQVIELLVEGKLSSREIIARGFKADIVNKVAKLLKTSEYKRYLGAIGPKISPRAFSKDWRYPITNKFNF